MNHALGQHDSEEEYFDVLTEDRLRPANHSSRRVLPTVVRRVGSRNLVNEALSRWRLSLQKQTEDRTLASRIAQRRVELHSIC